MISLEVCGVHVSGGTGAGTGHPLPQRGSLRTPAHPRLRIISISSLQAAQPRDCLSPFDGDSPERAFICPGDRAGVFIYCPTPTPLAGKARRGRAGKGVLQPPEAFAGLCLDAYWGKRKGARRCQGISQAGEEAAEEGSAPAASLYGAGLLLGSTVGPRHRREQWGGPLQHHRPPEERRAQAVPSRALDPRLGPSKLLCLSQARFMKETPFISTAWPESSGFITALTGATWLKLGVNFPTRHANFACEKTKS